MNRMQNKIAVVTGAARGIGLACAERFAREGAKVMLTDIDTTEGERVVAALKTEGLEVGFRRLDTRKADEWADVLQATASTWGPLNVLVNNAGIGLLGSIEDVTMADWRRTLDINLDGVFLGTQQGIAMMKANGGSIVNIASIEGLIGDPMIPAYNASKGGVRIFTKSAAIHCARQRYNIRINNVCPGFIETSMVKNSVGALPDGQAEMFHRALMERVPMGRLGQAAEIANAVLFLASDEASFVTGADLVVDGGHTAQ